MRPSKESDQDFAKFWAHMPWQADDETSIVLKGHLLVEDLLREYCSSKVKNGPELAKAKLTFSQAMHLAKALMSYPGPSWIWGGCEKLNSLRNDLAHNLTPANYEAKRNTFVSFVVMQSKASDKFVSTFPAPQQQLGIAVFLLHSAVSIYLRFKPPGLLSMLGS